MHVLIKPRNSLIESLLLCELLSRLRQVAANREPMGHMREQVDLVRHLQLIQDFLAFISFHRGKDNIPNYITISKLYTTIRASLLFRLIRKEANPPAAANTQGAFNTPKLIHLHHSRLSNESNIKLVSLH